MGEGAGAPGRQRAHSRAGWQLIELSMAIAVLAMISVAATRAIVALMAIESRSGQALQDAEVLARLGETWRSDLHRSDSATVANDGSSVELREPGGSTVTYRSDKQKLTREELTPARRSPAREVFVVSARTWRFEAAPGGHLYAIIRESAPHSLSGHGDTVSPPVIDRIDAALGILDVRKTIRDRGTSP